MCLHIFAQNFPTRKRQVAHESNEEFRVYLPTNLLPAEEVAEVFEVCEDFFFAVAWLLFTFAFHKMQTEFGQLSFALAKINAEPSLAVKCAV